MAGRRAPASQSHGPPKQHAALELCAVAAAPEPHLLHQQHSSCHWLHGIAACCLHPAPEAATLGWRAAAGPDCLHDGRLLLAKFQCNAALTARSCRHSLMLRRLAGPHDCQDAIQPRTRCSSIPATDTCCRRRQGPSKRPQHACCPCQRRMRGPPLDAHLELRPGRGRGQSRLVPPLRRWDGLSRAQHGARNKWPVGGTPTPLRSALHFTSTDTHRLPPVELRCPLAKGVS